MGLVDDIRRGFEKLYDRIAEIVDRQRNDTRRIEAIEKRLGPLVTDPNAQPAVAGSPILSLGEACVVKVISRLAAGKFTATRRILAGTGDWKWKDSDDTELITVRTLPLFGDGEDDKQFAELPVGVHVLCVWAGKNSNEDDIFYVLPQTWVQRFRVKSVQDDYLICRTWDGTTEGATDVYVAKPYYLRKTPYQNIAITPAGVGVALTVNQVSSTSRTVTKAGGSEDEIIIPAYTGSGYPGEEILAVCGVAGGTGVKVGTNDVIWHQVPDARMWAKVS